MTNPATQYVVKDPQGNIYGPAAIATLRQWIGEGRILPTMQIAPEGSADWSLVSSHPQLADLFATTPQPLPYQTPGTPATPSNYPTSPVNYQSAPVGPPKTNGMAIASLICSIVGCCCCVGGILGIIFGFMARKQIKESNGTQTGDGMALAGIIIGICTFILSIIGGILQIAMRNGGGGFRHF